MLKKLLFLLMVSLTTSPAWSYGPKIEVTLRNTGNETVYVAYAYHPWKGKLFTSSGWGPSRIQGWYALTPGQSKYFTTVEQYDQATFVFKKRGGAVYYKPKSNTNREIGAKTLYVNPAGNFKYEGMTFPPD